MDRQSLLYDIVMVYLIPYMHEIYYVRLETIPSLLTITGTISLCSEAIDCFKDSNSVSDGRGSKLRYSFFVNRINSTNPCT